MNIFTKEQVYFIKDNLNGLTNKQLAELVNHKFNTEYTTQQIKDCKKNRKLKSDKPKLKSFSCEKQHNYKAIGSERLQKDGYVYVKVSDDERWITKHKYLFEKHVRKLNKGEVVIFLNGDKTDFSIKNLEAVTRGELAQMNKLSYIKNNADLSKVGLNIIRIKDKIVLLKGDTNEK